MTVLFALQVCPVDCNAGLELAQLIAEMPVLDTGAQWLISYRMDTPLDRVMRMQMALSRKFPRVTSFRAHRYAQGWPAGANALWTSTMQYAAYLKDHGQTQCEGVLTFEADCVPARRDWMVVLDRAYAERKAPIVGNLHCEGIPCHINGNSIWPIDLMRIFPELLECPQTAAWDFHY